MTGSSVQHDGNSVDEPIRGYFDALNRSDPDGVSRVFAVDGTLMADETGTVTGREHIRTMFQQSFRALSCQRELHIDRVRHDGDMAAVETHTTGTFTIGGNTISAVSRELFILHHSPRGWEITDYMFNRPAPAGS
ncbi:MAG TPA: nuclear transport factor 2 family protein [Chloroflexota bacterium]|nr:nuclear transport factor 2 family protein [Chloroflexota bacterium]